MAVSVLTCRASTVCLKHASFFANLSHRTSEGDTLCPPFWQLGKLSLLKGESHAQGHQVDGAEPGLSVGRGFPGVPAMPELWLHAESPPPRTPALPLGLPAGCRSSGRQPGHTGPSCPVPAAAPGQPSRHPRGLSPAPVRLPGTLQKARGPGGSQSDRDFTLKPRPSGEPTCATLCALRSSWARLNSSTRPEHHQPVPKKSLPIVQVQRLRRQITTQGPTRRKSATDKGLAFRSHGEQFLHPGEQQDCLQSPLSSAAWLKAGVSTCSLWQLPLLVISLVNRCSAHLYLDAKGAYEHETAQNNLLSMPPKCPCLRAECHLALVPFFFF